MSTTPLEQYKFIRSEIAGEYNLIANRLGWLAALQAFLFSALVSGMKSYSCDPPWYKIDNYSAFEKIHYIKGFSLFYPLLAWLGFIISLSIAFGIWGALLRLGIWEAKQQATVVSNDPQKTICLRCVREGSYIIHLFGITPATFIPSAIIVYWIALLDTSSVIDISKLLITSDCFRADKEFITTLTFLSTYIATIMYSSHIFLELKLSKLQPCKFIYTIFSYIVPPTTAFLTTQCTKTGYLVYFLCILIGFIIGFLAYCKTFITKKPHTLCAKMCS